MAQSTGSFAGLAAFVAIVGGEIVAMVGGEHDALAAPPWVDRALTLPSGDFAFDFGLGAGHAPAWFQPIQPNTAVGINAEMAVGLTSRIELGVRTAVRFGDGPQRSVEPDAYGRLFDRQTFEEGADPVANPEIRIRGALVRNPVAELALEGRVVLPFASGTGAGLLFGVPLAFHLGERVRLDTGAYVPIVVPLEARRSTAFAVSLPLDVWIQVSPRFWLGPMTGLVLHQTDYDQHDRVSLGFGLGYEITRAVDFKAMFLFPAFYVGHDDFFGAGAGIQVRIE